MEVATLTKNMCSRQCLDKNKKYHTVGTLPKSNRKILERDTKYKDNL